MVARPVEVDPTSHEAWPAWRDALAARAATADAEGEPDVARRLVAAVLRHGAAVRGWALDDLAPTLLAGTDPTDPLGAALPPPPGALVGPDLLGAAHEALRAPGDRRARGAHYTSPTLAGRLLAWALDRWTPDGEARAGGPGPRGSSPGAGLTVVDLAAGGGAFLLAAARWQVARGVPPARALVGLGGVDIDPVAAAVAEAALVTWALDAGVAPAEVARHRPSVQVGDGLMVDRLGPVGPGEPGVLRAGSVDLVVGNPPFLGQLSRATARDRAAAAALRARYGTAAAGYADTAALFLVAGCRWARPGGHVVLVQPESVLGARDGHGARAEVAERADLVGLWTAGERAFAADVDVCAPVLRVRPDEPGGEGGPPVRRAWGRAVEDRPPSPPPGRRSWAPLLAASRGVPEVALDAGAGCVGDLATATAGFRQHFYGIASHLSELPDDAGDPLERSGADPGGRWAPLVTAGTVDPLALLWGRRPARVAGRLWRRPVVDLAALDRADAVVGAWVRARLRPKVVVAPQTRVVEAAVDAGGRVVPGVPLVSVEPVTGAPGPGPAATGLPPDPTAPSPTGEPDGGWRLWLLAAALSAPPVTAWALQETAGTARHGDALKLAARQVRSVPLPVDHGCWAEAAAALRAGTPLVVVGPVLTAAYGLDPDHPVTAWWAARLPR